MIILEVSCLVERVREAGGWGDDGDMEVFHGERAVTQCASLYVQYLVLITDTESFAHVLHLDLHDLSVSVGFQIVRCATLVGSAQTGLVYIVDSRRTMLLYAFVSKERISNTSHHGRHARMTWHSFTTPSQLHTIESLPKAVYLFRRR